MTNTSNILKLIVSLFVISYVTWNGLTIKTGGFHFELYPLKRFF